MQMGRICVCQTYADVLHMDMFSLYGFLSFSAQIRKNPKPEMQDMKPSISEWYS